MKKIIIFGLPSGGLFAAWQIRKHWPNITIFAIAPSTDLGVHSRVYDKLYVANSLIDLHDVALSAYHDIGEGDVYAFIFSNRFLEHIVGYHKELFSLLHFENPLSTYQTIVDKVKADSFCRELQINRPREYNISSEAEIAKINFPIVVKPLEKRSASGVEKCKYINGLDALMTYRQKLTSRNVSLSNIVAQQAVEGNNEFEFGYGGFFKDGHPVVDIAFFQFRQYPQGLSCYTREVAETETYDLLRRFVSPLLTRLNYNGYIEFDIKMDSCSRQLFLLDINPRPWGSADMLEIRLAKSTVYSPKLTRKLVCWRKPIDELFAHKNKKNTKYSKCYQLTNRSRYYTKCSLFRWYDPVPFLLHIFIDSKDNIKSLINDKTHQR